jgi:tyrosyl-tRNA synthetase
MMMTTNNSDSEHNIDDDDNDDDNSTRGMNNTDDSNNNVDGDEIIQTGGGGFCGFVIDITKDLYHSSGLVMNNKLNWLLIMGPIALLGDATGLLGETACFAFSGIALIPCAER